MKTHKIIFTVLLVCGCSVGYGMDDNLYEKDPVEKYMEEGCKLLCEAGKHFDDQHFFNKDQTEFFGELQEKLKNIHDELAQKGDDLSEEGQSLKDQISIAVEMISNVSDIARLAQTAENPSEDERIKSKVLSLDKKIEEM